MATRSTILAWKIPWREEPGWLRFMGSQRVGHNWACRHACYAFPLWMAMPVVVILLLSCLCILDVYVFGVGEDNAERRWNFHYFLIWDIYTKRNHIQTLWRCYHTVGLWSRCNDWLRFGNTFLQEECCWWKLGVSVHPCWIKSQWQSFEWSRKGQLYCLDRQREIYQASALENYLFQSRKIWWSVL